jgi:hypothetical protein
MLSKKRLQLSGSLCLLGTALFAMGQIPTALQPQQCGIVRKVWTNASPTAKSVKAFFQADCDEPKATGEITVYDQAQNIVLSFVIQKDHHQTLTFDVPASGYVNYICHPAHNTAQDQCASQILKVSDPSTGAP